MRVAVLAFCGCVALAAAAPFVIAPTVRHPHRDDEPHRVERDAPPSDEADSLAFSTFQLVAFSDAGCADSVSHAQVGDVPSSQSGDVEGIITFGNITVNGDACDTGAPDQILSLYTQQVLDASLPAGNVLGLTTNASRAVFIAGADASMRTCAAWQDDFLLRYAFTNHIDRILPSLAAAGLIESSTISQQLIDAPQMWMLSYPQNAPRRVCLYVRTNSHQQDEELVPTSTPEEDDLDDHSDPAQDAHPSHHEHDQDAQTTNETDTDASENKPTVFADAHAQALAMEEAEAAQRKTCFPASASVHLEGGILKPMSHLEIGDRVMVAPNTFSEVFMFTHKLPSGKYPFIKMHTNAGESLTTTSGHYVYINGKLTTADAAKLGDTLELADGTLTQIISLSVIKSTGLYNPQTLHGDIIVDNLRVSTYTKAIEPNTAHALLLPFRALFSRFSVYTSIFNGGASEFVNPVSDGPDVQ